MQSRHVSCTAVGFFTTLILWAATLAAWAAPTAYVAEPKAELGRRLAMEGVKHRFDIQNIGDETLDLRVKSVSCGCVANRSAHLEIAPSGAAEFEMGYSDSLARPRRGKQSFHVALTTNDPEQPLIALEMQVELVDRLHVIPSKIAFGEVAGPEGGAAEVLVELRAPQDDPVPLLTGSRATKKSLRVSLLDHVEKTEYGTCRRLKAELLPGVPSGTLRGAVILEAIGAEAPFIEIPVQARISYPYQMEPSILVTDLGDAHAEPLRLVRSDPTAPSPARATCGSDLLSAKLVQIAEDKEWQVLLNPTKSPPAEVVRSTVSLWSHDGEPLAVDRVMIIPPRKQAE